MRDILQAIVNTAASIGIRAADAQETQTELAATKRHLEDMRYLAKVRKDEPK